MSLALFLAAFGPASTRYGFPSGNSSAAPIDVFATVTPVSCEDVVFPPPRRADLWNLSTPNAEETQSPFSLGFLTKAVARVVYHELLRLFDAYAATGVVCPD